MPDSEFIPGGSWGSLDKSKVLAQCELFAQMPAWQLQSIANLTQFFEYKKDEIVFKEGDQPSGFYIIASGRVEAYTRSDQQKIVLSYLRRGDFFGEMSLLTNQMHSASVKALSDTVVLFMSKKDFDRVIQGYSDVASQISRILSKRLQVKGPQRSWLVKSDIISIFSFNPQRGSDSFSTNLACSLVHETGQKTILVELHDKNAAQVSRRDKVLDLSQMSDISMRPSGHFDSYALRDEHGYYHLNVINNDNYGNGANLTALLNFLNSEYRFVIVQMSGNPDSVVMKGLSQADKLFFVTQSDINYVTECRDLAATLQADFQVPDERIFFVVSESFMGKRLSLQAKKELFGSRVCYGLPIFSIKTSVTLHAHSLIVQSFPESEYARVVRHIARRLSNNLVGLCLGSGAALGLAHVGVIKALQKESIPIDMIAGSSIGALIGSFFALGKSVTDIEKAAREINTTAKLMKLIDFNIRPISGFLHGDLVIKHLRSHIGDSTFEDCLIPLKITSVNLSSRQSCIIDQGTVLDAVRASISIPAVFKPVMRGDDIIVDGGLLNPLPIDALHRSGANKVIAVDVFPDARDVQERKILMMERQVALDQSMQDKPWDKKMLHRIQNHFKKLFYPNFVDILMNTIQIMESEIAQMQSQRADVLIKPIVPTANWVDFFDPDKFIQKGYDDCFKQMPRIKRLVARQLS